MRHIPLGKLVALFPDGISLAAYNAIGRLIRAHGPIAKVRLESVSHEGLARAIVNGIKK